MAKKKRKTVRRVRPGRVLIVLLIPVLIVLGVFLNYRSSLKPVSRESEEINFTVNSGTSFRTVAGDLKDAGLIKSSSWTILFARMNDLSDVKAGDYVLNKNMSVEEILKVLNDPRAAVVDVATVTIIEGDWAKDIAAKCAAATTVSEEELLTLWNNKEYIRSLMDKYPFLTEEMFNDDIRFYMEGYLAPNTYQFYKETTAESITEKILDQSLVVYNKFADRMKSSSYSIHEIYTLASIVQYEAGDPKNMSMIAGVLNNRLDIDMPLQCSVTVCYSLDQDRADYDWKACEFNSGYDSPYNTYLHKGLPPGPIMNAGEDAIEAVLNPSASNYYFFMANVNTGEIYYAETLDEHNKNIREHGVSLN
ncbi:MAG: endolytic transglycosylase MltG [Solobacterium sp.]|nr:endolytic transglycosylase MltG [Solobacterium sp.]